MSGPRSRRGPALKIAAVWLAGVLVIGVVVIGLEVAHLSAGSSSGLSATASTGAAAGDPVGQVEAIVVAKRVRAATIAGQLLGGGRYDPAAYAGHIVVVNAWGSWCTPCQKELPVLRRLALARYATPVEFLGLDVEEKSMADGEAMARNYALPYPSIYDEDRSVYDALAPLIAPSGVPGTVVIDAQGRVAATVIGAVDETKLAAFLRQLAAGTG
jgi:thiol-disulfide isomerase/thioredoxin